MSEKIVLGTAPLGFLWQTLDPFLFCAHHLDRYPVGNEKLGPAASLEGRNIGQDFGGKDGWSMYHGSEVPGFPRHPHRGFETVTIARQGYIDHADSMGAKARFGNGDVQWMTAGKGVVHSETFPLVHTDKPNTTELFQVWLNLPRASKMVEPHFKMFWSEDVPNKVVTDAGGKVSEVAVIAGRFDETTAIAPPPESWAANPESDVAIWTIKMEAGAQLTLPAASKESNRMLYFFVGNKLQVAETELQVGNCAQVKADAELALVNGSEAAEILILQGRPLNEPVAQQGPFVMNYPGEIRQAMIDYHQTGFGGWPWDADAPVHPREQGRFALHGLGGVLEERGRRS